jgi:putative nucleotidyltransferase with HDIG domain
MNMPTSEQDIRNRLLVARLPALPHIIVKLLEYCRTDNVGMAELAEIIAKDPAIAAKILGVANSSAFHRNGQKVRLEQSLISLGTDMIRTLAISESVFQTFNGLVASSRINLRGFWKHSLAAAVLARDIAKKMGYANIDEAYLGGLLHDVGRLAILAVAPNDYAQNFHAIDDATLCVVEQRTMQISHPEAGAWLVERWKLDSFLADSVLYHHEPISRVESAHPLIRIVYLSHLLASQRHDEPAVEQAGRLCQLSVSDMGIMRQDAESKVIDAAKFLGIDLAGADEVPSHVAFIPQSAAQKKLNNELQNMLHASETARAFSRQTSESDLLEAITRSARILFQLDDAIILTAHPSSQTLIGNPEDLRARLSSFSMPLAGKGPIAESVLQQQPACIAGDSPALSIAEEQLIRILDVESLVCMPLVVKERLFGVVVGGAPSLVTSDLRRNLGFLQTFGSQASSALHSLRSKQDEARKLSAASAEEFRLASLKVAHEVNNPLFIIKNYLNLLNDKLARQEPVSGEISVLNEEIDRVSKILRQFASPQPATRQSATELNKVVQSVLRIFRDTGFAPASVKLIAKTEDQPDEIDCEDGVVKQILINLLKNAIEAMPGGGEILVENRGYATHDRQLYIELCVKDTGPGIPKPILEKIFSPHNSTKGEPNRGLGLSIVNDLVKKAQGFITCRSNSSGTTFEILFPVSNRKTTNSAPGSPP